MRSGEWLGAQKRRLLRLFVALTVLVVVGGCSYLFITFYALDGPSIEQGRERASELLATLEKYREAHGQYPAVIEALVPEYLPSIPRPAWRYEYTYDACSDGTGYILYFELAGTADDWCGYSSGAGQWKCTDSLPPYFYDRPCISNTD